MKKTITFFKSLLLVVLLLVGSGSVYGQYSGIGTFTKITSLVGLTDGYYVIVNSGDGFAMNNTHNGTYLANTAVTPLSGTITNPATSIVWKIEANGTGRTIYNEATSKYVSYTGSSNNVQVVDAVTANNQRWTFTYASNVFTVKNAQVTTRILQYNSSSPRFLCYLSSSNQQNLLLYKMAATCSAPTFSFASATVNKLTTDAAFTNAFTSNNTSTKVWSSTNEAVATVDATGLVTIHSAGTTSIKVNQAADATYCAVVDASYALTVTAPGVAEPTNQPTELSATTNSTSQITVTWADAKGAQLPEHYLVKASTGTITAPVDGTAEADAALVQNIAQGTQTAVFTGLDASTTYNFSIWPYTNSGAAIDYKTDGTVATASATTVSATNASDYFRSKSSGNWSDINTWESSSDGISWIPATLTPTATSNNITVLDGNTVTLNESVSVDQLKINTGGKIIINSSITLTIANGSGDFDLLVEGIVENSGTITASTDAVIKFNGGGYYKHTRNGGSCVIATWDNNSTCEIAGVVGTAVTNLSQSFGNFIWNCTSQSSWINLALTSSFAVAGDLTINSTSTYGLNAVTSTVSREFNIGGNLLLNGAKLTLANNSGIATLNIGGNLMLSANSLNQLDLGYGNFNPTGNYRSIINLSGDLNVGLGAIITCTDNNANDDNGKIVFNKPSVQNISNNGTISWIDFEVLNGSTLVLNTDLDSKSLQIKTGGVLNVPAAKQLTITGTATNNGTITIQSDENGTGTIVGNVSGAATVNQHLSSYRTWYLSSPVSNVAPSNMDRYKFYDETTGNWSTTAPAQTIGAGFLAVPTNNAVTSTSFTGTLNNGNININVTRSVGNGSKPGFNLVGNPYPSYLEWSKVNDANSSLMPSSTMWYRTKKLNQSSELVYQFWTVNGDGVGSPNGASQYIPPMQAFWVRAKSSGQLQLTNDMRSHAPATDYLLKAPAVNSRTLIRLELSNGTNTDEAVLYLSENANNALDALDAPKMSIEDASIAEIFTRAGNEKLVINALQSLPKDTEIALGFEAGSATTFTLRVNELSNLPSDVKLILKDNVTKAETDLTDGTAVYSFGDIATSGDRFSIIFRTSGAITGIDQPTFSGLTAYSNANNQLTVLYYGAIDAQTVVSVYNAVGQRLVTQSLKGVSTVIDGEFAPGVYVVKVNNLSRKLTIKK